MTTLILATLNQHKADEIRAILGPERRCLTLEDRNAPVVKEDAPDFAGNASKKALSLVSYFLSQPTDEYFFQRSAPVFILADDSGLEVDALNGAPGVHSARFAALDTGADGNSTDAENSAKLLRLLKHVPLEKRTARFRCVLALAPALREQKESASPICYADETELQIELFEGACEGRILFEPRGSSGFGYDPLFVPNGFDRTFAELGESEKNQISHRANALKKLKQRLAAMPHSH